MTICKGTGRGPGFKDLSGQRFGRLVVLRYERSIDRRACWLCLCDCGTEKVIRGKDLLNKKTVSCGCLAREKASKRLKKHGRTGSSLYVIWKSMITRCTNRAEPSYKNYGGRGITVCDRWRHSFANFLADVGERPSTQHSIDRIDNNGNYEPGNCRWATRLQQVRNSRHNHMITFRGETLCLSEWAERTGISRAALTIRILRSGWSIEKALTTPMRH